MKKNYKFVVVVTCQGNPNYYYRNTLVGALFEYAKQYLTKNKYGTMNFTLRQEFNQNGIESIFKKNHLPYPIEPEFHQEMEINMKIISYVEMKADKFKAEIGNSQVDLFNPKDYQYIKELKNNDPNIVRCIPLDDINSFSLTEKPTEDMCKILDENGFVINGIDRYGNDFYIRKELLQ